MKIKLLLLFVFTFQCLALYSQDKSLFVANIDSAILWMDRGDIEPAIELLEQTKKMDKGNYIYDYEIGYANYLRKDLKGAAKAFKKATQYDNANDQCYQSLGNMYDILGKPKKALKVYEKGLKKFPESGRIYLEMGNLFWNQKSLSKALYFYEEGIKVDPFFSSNYYRATLCYMNSTEKVWGMIYGEIFMNIERNSKRTQEISKLLFDTYASQIDINPDSTHISFSKQNTINITLEDLTNGLDTKQLIKNSYGTLVYETTMAVSLANQKEIDLSSLYQIRKNFIELYQESYGKEYPVSIFEYKELLIEKGLFEAYSYWILSEGNPEEFSLWHSINQDKWEDFINWFVDNPFSFEKDKSFHSGLYQ
ncbi:tetratricopeptide repeat protein [Sediminitomix flava]|uniref:Tetratricopeptide repeat protein n=1 Tax=Sediminitomix flava TaxID=379075 RepID=A0A316A4E2_SEDFL|nr:tetratricopeptide repeat protein [Sediminitomix flava]PWJ44607.1 tetratricopeptide repeat protein [Sediminitomix flava]